ncbi:MAG: Crp/Fnr family transcriptional regulator [Flammeovirgaceae bacterium]
MLAVNESLIKKHFPLLHHQSLIDEIMQVATLREVKSGTVMMEIGRYIKFVPLMLSGSIKISREDDDGNEVLLYFLEVGHTCAMSLMCCFEEGKSSIRAVVEDDAQLLMIPIQYMDEWMAKYRSWRHFVMMSYASRFEEMLNTIDSIAFHSMDQRLEKYLRDRSNALKTRKLSITHQQIAYDLNSSREAVSRLLKKMERTGKITLGRNKIDLAAAFV